jgi:hypothetical protein
MVATPEGSFNWETIVSNQLCNMIEKVHKIKQKICVVNFFYMASYILDVICARNVFLGINLSCNISEAPIHVYF